MPKLSESELLERDAQRDLNAELLESIRDMKDGQLGRVTIVTRTGKVIESPVTRARVASCLSQVQFANLLGVSVRTLQDWEQGRRSPSGAAKTLLRLAEMHPNILHELAVSGS